MVRGNRTLIVTEYVEKEGGGEGITVFDVRSLVSDFSRLISSRSD